MAGHSKWAQIKHQKGVADSKRGALFSKLLKAIAVAARSERDPKFNPRLRSAVLKAKEHNVPRDAIERAIARAGGREGGGPEELLCGAYDARGDALLIRAITDNKNRTITEVKGILARHGAKWAEPGSVVWAFEEKEGGELWAPKFPKRISSDEMNTLAALVRELEAHDDILGVFTNAAP